MDIVTINIPVCLDVDILENQMWEVQESNIPKSEKDGLLNLLGYLWDATQGRI